MKYAWKSSWILGAALILGGTASGFGQVIDYKFLDGLAQKAKESSVIELGPEQLSALASMSGKSVSEDLAKVVKSIHVHSYEFDRKGMYDPQQVRDFRDRVKASGNWVNLVSVKEGEGFTDIMMKKNEGNGGGLLIVAAEDNELTIVHIDGVSDLKSLGELGGLVGIPQIGGVGKSNPKPAPRPKAEPKK
jgi:hypothetical protein